MARRAGVAVTATSNSKPVDEIYNSLLGGVGALSQMGDQQSKARADLIGRKAVAPLKKAFDNVAREWKNDVENALDSRARAEASSPFYSWTRHLYAGGDPANMGDGTYRLMTISPDRSTVSSLGLDFDFVDDNRPSWSPVRQSSQSEFGRPYPPWKDRARFMMAPYVNGWHDAKYISGEKPGFKGRGKMIGPSDSPNFYIINKKDGGGANEKYVLADNFKMDYRIMKANRDQWLERQRSFTTEELIARMDKGLQAAVFRLLKSAQAMANVEQAKGGLSRSPVSQATPKLLKQRGRNTQNLKDANRYAAILAEHFAAMVGKRS